MSTTEVNNGPDHVRDWLCQEGQYILARSILLFDNQSTTDKEAFLRTVQDQCTRQGIAFGDEHSEAMDLIWCAHRDWMSVPGQELLVRVMPVLARVRDDESEWCRVLLERGFNMTFWHFQILRKMVQTYATWTTNETVEFLVHAIPMFASGGDGEEAFMVKMNAAGIPVPISNLEVLRHVGRLYAEHLESERNPTSTEMDEFMSTLRL